MNNNKFNIAVLIDGDNAQAKLIKEILEEVSKYGKATIRRIYGDWTTPHMNSWKEMINLHSFSPIQKFSYTTGKNSTDSSMIIDAMDILHSNSVDGFCIVSSDSDYTGLAKRIREEGMFVMGIGRRITPKAFVQSCEIFTYAENLLPAEKPKPTPKKAEKSQTSTNRKNVVVNEEVKKEQPEKENAELDLSLIDKAFEISSDEEEEIHIAKIGASLRKIDPSFDPRSYGFRNLTELFKNLDKYVVVKNLVNGLNYPLVKLK
ncbi:NYN domain-containing protein [Algoriphagus halophytocola]|uniref:NYN domain-containing protein n=1 Tax=Algoriphagus halophytocola TaxID=2991499 RepID=A0ABY6MKH7_9BACT|nr:MULTISPECIES: NYN domain-containing protein [unclassified Algoriphagus]UZD24153.1 NYN domain-containing protein [Algoriphagus sp. TR-M5]WBL41524.1 NYN domain-containing protein [Algoriphagus sp. TR-M9]